MPSRQTKVNAGVGCGLAGAHLQPKQCPSEAHDSFLRAPIPCPCPPGASKRLRPHSPRAARAPRLSGWQAGAPICTLRRQCSRPRKCDGIEQRAPTCEHTQRGKLAMGPLRSLREGAHTCCARLLCSQMVEAASELSAVSARELARELHLIAGGAARPHLVRISSPSSLATRLTHQSRRGRLASKIRPPPLGRVGSGGNSNTTSLCTKYTC